MVSPSVARAIVCPPNLNLCRLPVMARFSTFENLLCLVELLLRRHRSLLQSTTAKWTHWDLNPGPSACEADVIPLHHVPSAPARGYWLILANTKLSCLCTALGKNSCYNGNVAWRFQAMRDIGSGKHKERHRKRHPPWGSNPRPQG